MGHEGAAYRWETFNRWCDEFAEKHQGLKPKVDDVRRWHRENAEKVWPDSTERPSVFMAVSHNKGRRVRGSKTCEYYKRYRAGKAAEQQLAARLQPAALSGRRILAVTAAARKLNSDGSSRGPGKRHVQDDGGSEEHADGSHEQPEKRRRMQAGHRGQSHAGSRGGGARGRRSSSEEFSEDPSWASGAESSEDEDSGGNGTGSGSMRSSRHPSAQQQQQPGVHITVVKRDADGRTIQVQSAAPPMLTGLLPLPGAPPLFQPPAVSVPGSSGRAVAQPLASSGLRRRSSGHVEDGSDDALACKEDASDGAQPRADSASQRPRRQRRAMPVEEPEEGDEVMPDELQQIRMGRRSATQDWDWGPDGHPGIAPLECRSSRSASVLQPALPPPLSGHVDTPLGALPVYLVAASSGGIMAARRRIAEQRKKKAAAIAAAAAAATVAPAAPSAPAAAPATTTIAVAAPAAPNATAPASAAPAAPVAVAPPRPNVAVAAPAGAPVGAPGVTKDPLDLLAQAACEALATPVPPRAGVPAPPQADQPKEGGATTVPQEAVGEAMDCKGPAPEAAQRPPVEASACGPGISEGSAHSGGGFAPPGCRGQSVPEAAPKLVPIKEEQAGAAADDAQSSGQHAPAGVVATVAEGNGVHAAVSECVSASTQNSGGPHASLNAQPAAQAPAPAEAAAQAQQHQAQAQVQNTTASPHSSAALLATDAVDWATTGDGDTEATGCTHAPKQDVVLPLLDVGAAATTSSVATAPSGATVALPAPAAAAAAHGRCPSAGATSDATGALPTALAPLLTPDMSMNFAYMAAANAAAVNMATMAAAFLRAQPPLPQQAPQQPAPALPLPVLPATGTPAQGLPVPGAAPAVPQPLGSVGSVMSSFLLPPPPPVGSLPLPPAQPAATPPLLSPGTLPLLPPPLWHSMPAGVPAMPPSMAAAAAVAAAPPLFQESPATVLGAPPAGCNQLLPVMRLFMASSSHSEQVAVAGAQPAPIAGVGPPVGTALPQLPPMALPLPPVPQPSALPTPCAMPGCMPPPVMDMGLVGGGAAATQQHTPGFLMAARPLQPSQ
ncbi:hypothetical protein HYH02_010776 [Chlamydomonas schloesseri]|uniref:Uncharacterized protein n=1 Tax=Chlamydomonas schloesseri TaxID=2026947 RepID=A0A835T523_9CHLO|nr:hypothetical protein HYH02_010776 [Chlamydomonas schloesseri]|eukprot:KAG2438984.1 hypothetical protein HYH02_010776 [Chlamydomonas schloesseri]